jgi:hypothetical protein
MWVETDVLQTELSPTWGLENPASEGPYVTKEIIMVIDKGGEMLSWKSGSCWARS